MTCKECTKAAASKHHGVYQMTCLMCCARLVVSARFSKMHQEAMLAVIARTHGAPSRQQVLDCIRQHYPAKPKPTNAARIEGLRAALGQ